MLLPRDRQDDFIAALKEHHHEFFPEGSLNSKSYSRIVSDSHFTRLKSVLAQTKGEVVLGGKTDDKRGFELTVVKNVEGDDPLLEEHVHPLIVKDDVSLISTLVREIFGPILPLVPVDSVGDAVAFINSRFVLQFNPFP